MTVSSTTRKAGPFAGNDATTEFPFAFKVFADTDVLVVMTDSAGVEAEQVLDTDYTLALNADQDANPGGTITMIVAPATGEKLTATSQVPNLQGTDITNAGGFYPQVIEDALDRNLILIQQLQLGLDRSMVMPLSSDLANFELDLGANAAGRADRVIGFDADGNPTLHYASGTTQLGIDLASADSGKGAALVGTKLDATGSVARTQHQKNEDVIHADDFGLVGDGTDENAKVQSALNAAQGRTLVLGIAKTYGITAINIPNDVTIIDNGSRFKKLAESSSFAITGGVRLKCGVLWLETVGGATDVGISLNGERLKVDEIRVDSLAADAGYGGGSDTVGLMIGPATGTAYRASVGKITVSQFCRPVQLRNLRDCGNGHTKITGYRRGVYIKDCKNIIGFGATITGLSPSSVGGPGDNALLIESTSDSASEHIHLYGWHAEDSGEHAFRLGGQYPIRNVWATNCSARRPGAAAGATGGCGFKAQGSSSTGYHYNINLHDFVVEDGNVGGGNFCGVLFILVDCGKITNPTIRNKDNASSTWHGLSFLSCNDVTVTNPTVKNAGQHALRMYSAAASGFTNGQSDVVVVGGHLENVAGSAAPVVSMEATDTVFTRCGVRGATVRRGTVALNAQTPGAGGGYTACFASLTYLDTEGSGAHLSGTGDFLVDMTVSTANVSTPASSGSIQRARGGRAYIKDSGGWASLVGSFKVTIADDAVYSWTPLETNQFVFVTAPSVSAYGQAWVRTTSSPASAKIAGPATFATMNSALTGTTGTDGNVTLGAQNGALYLENRSGGSLQFSVGQIG